MGWCPQYGGTRRRVGIGGYQGDARVYQGFGQFAAAGTHLQDRLLVHSAEPRGQTRYQLTVDGEESVGVTWIRFNSRFYVVALIFLVFDVEVLFLFPWAVNLKDLGLFAWIDMAIFIAILGVGLAYVWGKGDLEWVRPKDSSTGSLEEQ